MVAQFSVLENFHQTYFINVGVVGIVSFGILAAPSESALACGCVLDTEFVRDRDLFELLSKLLPDPDRISFALLALPPLYSMSVEWPRFSDFDLVFGVPISSVDSARFIGKLFPDLLSCDIAFFTLLSAVGVALP